MPTFVFPGRAAKGRRPSQVVRNPQTPQAQGLLGWWPLQGDLKDYTAGPNLPLTMNGLVSPVAFPGSANIGLCAPSNGTTNFAVNNSVVGLGSLTQSLSMSFWVMQNTATIDGKVFCIGTGSGGINLCTFSSHLAWQRGTDGGVVVEDASISLPTYVAQFVVFTNDGTNRVLYRNGLSEATSTTSIDSGTISRVGLYVNSHSGFPQGPAAGVFAFDLRFYNRCLSAQDVWIMYDPATRWDLYWVPSTKTFFDIGAAFNAATFPRATFDDFARRPDRMIPSGRVA